MKKREKTGPSDCPKLSPSKLLKDNWFLLSAVFSAAPLGTALYAAEQFRVGVMIFFEHTWMMQQVLECIEFKRSFKDALIPILIITSILVVTSILGSVVLQWQLPKAKLRAQTKIKNMIFEKAHEVDIKQFDDPAYYNDFVMSSEKVSALVDYIYDIIYAVASSLATLVTAGVYFAVESAPSFILIMASAAFQLFFLLRNSKLNYAKSLRKQKYTRRSSYINRLFYFQDYAKEIRLSSELKDKAFEDYDEACDGLVKLTDKFNRRIAANSIGNMSMQMIIMDLLLVLVLVYQASVLGIISYSTVIIMINSSYRLQWAFRLVIFKIATSAENCMYVEKIRDFISKEPQIVSDEKLPVGNEPCSLELKNVSFRYNDTDGDVIRGVSMKLKPKEKIALVGYNGAGKTTLIKLLLRLYDPSEGEILMNGVDIRRYDVERYRHNIGVVFQDFNIYAATVGENVVMGIPGGGDGEKIRAALCHSGFEDRLEALEHGIDTVLTKEFDDGGVNLSGGEGQKIAIARAFFKNSGFIILDEPSSALDPIAEYNFNRYMAQAAKDCTVIFISHRLSTTRLADRIYVLEDGKICEEGTHGELLKSNGKYAKMWHTQADKYILDT